MLLVRATEHRIQRSARTLVDEYVTTSTRVIGDRVRAVWLRSPLGMRVHTCRDVTYVTNARAGEARATARRASVQSARASRQERFVQSLRPAALVTADAGA
jgi:hypothetical protein